MGVPKFDQPLFRERTERVAIDALPEVAVSPEGHTVPVAWAPVAGATEAEVTEALAEIGPTRSSAIETVQTSPAGSAYDLTIPAHKRVLSIDLTSMRWVHTVPNEDGIDEQVKTQLRNESDLGNSVRVTVATRDTQNQMTTVYAVPHVGARRGIPAQFLGANLSNSVLSVPELDARKVRIALVDQERPDEWSSQGMELGSSVAATMVTLATDLSLLGPDGTQVFGFPGEFPTTSPRVSTDLRAPIEAFFTKALKEGSDPAGQIVLKAANTANVGFRFSPPHGALIRSIRTIPTIRLEGDPVTPQFTAAGEPELADEAPASAIASISVVYEGIRLLETVQAAVPARRDVSGQVVGANAVLAELPPAALVGKSVARVGLVGRPPEPCELSVQLVDARTSPPKPLGTPGVIRLDTAEQEVRTVWVDMPTVDTGDAPVTVSVRATRGRFFWCAEAQPLVRLAVYDPDPGGRAIFLDSGAIHSVETAETSAPAVTLPVSAFRRTPGTFRSDLFVTIELADVVLRYAR